MAQLDDNALVPFTESIQPHLPELRDVMRGGPMAVERLIATAHHAFRRNPQLLQCRMDSLIECLMTAADLWLIADPVAGQFFMLPFRQKGVLTAQSCIGYKGYVTLGHREGLAITGEAVRDGDEFSFRLGTNPFVHHVPKRGNRGRIIWAWAQASAPGRADVIKVVDRDEIDEIMKRNPAVKAGATTPWTDKIGFPAMCAKTPVRRLSRALPIGAFTVAALVDEAFEERGKHAYVRQHAVVIEGEAPAEAPVVAAGKKAPRLAKAQPAPPDERQQQLGLTPAAEEGRFLVVWGKSPGNRRYYPNVEAWRSNAIRIIHDLKSDDPAKAKKQRVKARSVEDKLEAMRELMGPVFDGLDADFPQAVAAVIEALDRRLGRGRGRW